MLWQHTVFAVIAAELGKEGHRLLGALRDQFAEHPVQRLAERGALAVHVGRKQVAHRDVEGEPAGVEPVDELVAGPSRGRRRRAAPAARRDPRGPRTQILGAPPHQRVDALVEQPAADPMRIAATSAALCRSIQSLSLDSVGLAVADTAYAGRASVTEDRGDRDEVATAATPRYADRAVGAHRELLGANEETAFGFSHRECRAVDHPPWRGSTLHDRDAVHAGMCRPDRLRASHAEDAEQRSRYRRPTTIRSQRRPRRRLVQAADRAPQTPIENRRGSGRRRHPADHVQQRGGPGMGSRAAPAPPAMIDSGDSVITSANGMSSVSTVPAIRGHNSRSSWRVSSTVRICTPRSACPVRNRTCASEENC